MNSQGFGPRSAFSLRAGRPDNGPASVFKLIAELWKRSPDVVRLHGESPVNSVGEINALGITRPEAIRPAAKALRDLAWELGSYSVVASHNIASKQPMVDADGEILADSVFGFDDTDAWWRNSTVALYSPIARACRYESEPVWVSARRSAGRAGPFRSCPY